MSQASAPSSPAAIAPQESPLNNINNNNNNNNNTPAPTTTPFTIAQLLNHLRVLALRHDELGQEIVLNEILRQAIAKKDFVHADLIITNNQLKQPYRSTNQAARYCYYVALTKAIRLEYSEANNYVSQALRKAPERALGFRIAATKLYLTLQLLLGEIPPRSEFLDPAMKEALHPYMQLASCVRFATLNRFISLLKQHRAVLEHDHTHSLLLRVRYNVVKTGLRRICQAYSRIKLTDIACRLVLDNPDDVEYIVSKAIRDGVIEATIDQATGTVCTSNTVDVYRTTEPLHALQRRTAFLNSTTEEAKRAMVYLGSIDPELEEERRRKEEADREMAEFDPSELDDFDSFDP